MPELTDAFDPRFTLARPDLAAQALEGLYPAKAFRTPHLMQCSAAVTDLRAEADAGADRVDQLLFGEHFEVLETQDGFAFGRARRDGMVGWVAEHALAEAGALPTHRMAAVGADLPLNALCGPQEGAVPVGSFASDPVAVAEQLLGVPHALGARSSLATDCSGLVQQALLACGWAGPRNADEQAALGQAVDRNQARRGDIVVWPWLGETRTWTGHSALMLDETRVIHASGDRGGVVIEDFADADARYRADGFEPPVFRRVSAWG